ncbi:MAG: hypothetical protein WD738_23180 [Pirellulales bacterium]
MRVFLLVVGVFGLAAVFTLCEPAPASSELVTSGEVQLVSEQMPSYDGPQGFGRSGYGKHGKHGIRH